MNLELNPDGFCLKPKQVLKVRGGVGHAIVCHSGSLWVTQHRDRRDIVLDAGETFTLDRNGLALVQALAQSAVSIVPTAPGVRTAAPAAWSGRSEARFAGRERAPVRSGQGA